MPICTTGVVMTLEGRLLDDVAPPRGHHSQHRDEGDDEQPGPVIVHVEDAARGERAGRGGADQGPYARIDEVILVLGAVLDGDRAFAHDLAR